MRLRLLLSFMLTPLLGIAQDIHFSQFNRSYLNLNPALCGSFKGDYRLNGNFRNQWSSISEPYQTFSFAADARGLIQPLPSLNVGLVVSNDQAGVGDLQSSLFLLNLSYIHALTSDSSLSIKGGFQFGLNNRSINYDAFSFDNQFRSGQFDSQFANGENFSNNSMTNLAFNAGVSIEYLIEERRELEVGISFFNLNQANQSFQGESEPLDLRTTIFIESEQYLSKDLDILPALLYSSQGEFSELTLGTNFRYYFSKSSYYKRNLYLGIWWRKDDAIIPSAGLDYNQWHFGVSYDLNISSLEVASNQRGGLELAVTYLFSQYKPINRKYKQCPKFL